MTILRLSARAALPLLPFLALAACGSSSREAELEKQLAEAKAQLQADADARKQAEQQADAATRNQARNAALDSFYADSGSTDQSHDGEGDGGPDHIAPPGNPVEADAASAPQGDTTGA